MIDFLENGLWTICWSISPWEAHVSISDGCKAGQCAQAAFLDCLSPHGDTVHMGCVTFPPILCKSFFIANSYPLAAWSDKSCLWKKVWSSIPRIKARQCWTWGVNFQCAQKPREEWPEPRCYFLPSADEEPTVAKHILTRANNSLPSFKTDLNKKVFVFCKCFSPRPSLPLYQSPSCSCLPLHCYFSDALVLSCVYRWVNSGSETSGSLLVMLISCLSKGYISFTAALTGLTYINNKNAATWSCRLCTVRNWYKNEP